MTSFIITLISLLYQLFSQNFEATSFWGDVDVLICTRHEIIGHEWWWVAWWRQRNRQWKFQTSFIELCVIIMVGYSTQWHSLLLLIKDGVILKCFSEAEGTCDHHPRMQLQRFLDFLSQKLGKSLRCFPILLGNSSLSLIMFWGVGSKLVIVKLMISRVSGNSSSIIICFQQSKALGFHYKVTVVL